MANICCISNTFGGSVSGHSLSSWALVNALTFLGIVGEVYSPLSFPNLYSVLILCIYMCLSSSCSVILSICKQWKKIRVNAIFLKCNVIILVFLNKYVFGFILYSCRMVFLVGQMQYVHDTTKFCAEIAQLTPAGQAAY